MFESQVPRDRRGAVAAHVRAAAVTCTVRRNFYTYAAAHGLAAGCDYLRIQPATDHAALAALRAELADIEDEIRPQTPENP